MFHRQGRPLSDERPLPSCNRTVLSGRSEHLKTRIQQKLSGSRSQDGKMVLVEEGEEGEVEAAEAVAELMYLEELPLELSTVQLAKVRLCCVASTVLLPLHEMVLRPCPLRPRSMLHADVPRG
jgi:hypothetical protein